jgi:hypothetical protein
MHPALILKRGASSIRITAMTVHSQDKGYRSTHDGEHGMFNKRKIFGLLALILGTTACGGGGGNSAAEDTAPAASIDCTNIQLAQRTAAPFDNLQLSGLPDDFGASFVVASADDSTTIGTVSERDGGNLSFLAPPHPVTPTQGGEAALFVDDGSHRCPLGTISILPMPEVLDAAAEIDSFALRLKEYHELTVADYGLTAEQIRNTDPATMSADLVPLFLAQHALDAAIDALSRDTTTLSADERTALAQILAQTTANDILNQLIADHVPSPRPMPVMAARPPDNVTRVSARTDAVAVGEDLDLCAVVPSAGFGAIAINDAATLDSYMTEQFKADLALNGPNTKKMLSGLGYAAAGAGIVSAPVGVAAGFALYAHSMVQGYKANLYPSSLDSLSFNITRDGMLPEDYMDARGPQVLPRWSEATVVASSKGWNLTKPTFDTVLQLTGAFGAAKDALSGTVKSLGENVAGALDGVAWGELANGLDAIKFQSECLQIPARKFTGIDVSEETWTRSTIGPGSIRKIGHQTFEPVNIGTATIKVETRDGKFGFKVAKQERPVDILGKIVNITPSLKLADPDSLVTLIAQVTNSEFPTVPVEWDSGQAAEVSRESNDINHSILLLTPPSETSFPVHVGASSTTMTLPAGSPPRSATATILAKDIILAPQTICIKPGDQHTFTADVSSLYQGSVNWSVSGGNLSTSTSSAIPHHNTYTAPAAEGQYILRASIDADTFDEANIRVGGCVDMAIYGTAAISVNPPTDQCAAGSADNTGIERELTWETPPKPPALPAAFWRDRSETISDNLADSWQIGRNYGDSTTPQCKLMNLPASASGAITYQGDDNGTATFNMSGNYQYTCDTDPDGDTACSSAGAGDTGVLANYYLPVSDATRYRVQAEINCSGTGTDNHYGAFFAERRMFTVGAIRYLNGTGAEVDGNYCEIEACTPDEVTFVPMQTLDCYGTQNSIQIDTTMNLRAPPNENQQDLVILSITLGPDLRGIDVPQALLEAQSPGQHNGQLNLQATFSVSPLP